VSGYGVLIFAIVFVSGLGMTSLFLVWLLARLAQGTPAEPASALATRLAPPGPRLQASIVHPTTPAEDLARLQQRERYRLQSYGWVDRDKQIAHIPIEWAMSIYLEKGAPPEGLGLAMPDDASNSSAATGGGP